MSYDGRMNWRDLHSASSIRAATAAGVLWRCLTKALIISLPLHGAARDFERNALAPTPRIQPMWDSERYTT